MVGISLPCNILTKRHRKVQKLSKNFFVYFATFVVFKIRSYSARPIFFYKCRFSRRNDISTRAVSKLDTIALLIVVKCYRFISYGTAVKRSRSPPILHIPFCMDVAPLTASTISHTNRKELSAKQTIDGARKGYLIGRNQNRLFLTNLQEKLIHEQAF